MAMMENYRKKILEYYFEKSNYPPPWVILLENGWCNVFMVYYPYFIKRLSYTLAEND
ncbi:MAG: hypothetical protein IJT36_00860 [Alphaproteobacteria bacterium]|nr:hypothetical protein [Alphaproteobacteria bacterium]